MFVLHHYAPDRYGQDQEATWKGLALCRAVPGVQVMDVIAYSDVSRSVEMEKLWGRGQSIVDVDMDIAIHPWHLSEFDRCSEQACVFAHYINGSDAPGRKPVLCHRHKVGDVETPIEEGEEWAEFVGPALLRIRPELQASIVPRPAVPRVHFHDYDHYLSERLGNRFHVHWPAVAHHHLWM